MLLFLIITALFLICIVFWWGKFDFVFWWPYFVNWAWIATDLWTMQEFVNGTKQNKVWCDDFNAMLLIGNEICYFISRTQLNRQNTTKWIWTFIQRWPPHLEPKKIVKNYLSSAVSLFLLLFLPQFGKSHVSEYLT